MWLRWFPTPKRSQTMLDQPQRQRQAPDLETNTAPDQLRDDLRRRDQQQTPPDSVPPGEAERAEEEPVGGGFTPKADGGNEQHPIHDEDQEDATPDDYERGNRQARRSGARPLALTWRSKFCCAGAMTSISRMAPTRLFGNEAPAHHATERRWHLLGSIPLILSQSSRAPLTCRRR
jgi:hypothetical protein